MFSGIVLGIGRVVEQADVGGDRRVTIDYAGVPMPSPGLGASIAVNGVCLTAISTEAAHFTVDVSAETLAVTTLGSLGPGAQVNLEPALAIGDRLDGHIVAGHVDGVARVLSTQPAARSVVVAFDVPGELARYIARKGSVAVDGVSLTVNAVRGTRFEVNVVPHTQTATIFGTYGAGTAVNIEIDLVARYLERLLTTDRSIE